MYDALEGTGNGCFLDEPICRRPVLAGPPPRRPAVRRPVPMRPWYVLVLDATGLRTNMEEVLPRTSFIFLASTIFNLRRRRSKSPSPSTIFDSEECFRRSNGRQGRGASYF